MSEENTSKNIWGSSLRYACIRFLGKALWRQGAASNDLVDSMALKLEVIASEKAEWVDAHVGDWKIVERAIDYMSAIHDGPWRGEDWFRNTLEVLIEIVVPNTGLDECAAAFLLDIQHGAATAYQSAPIEKSALRVTDHIAHSVKLLEEAGCGYGLVSEILDVAEAIFHGEQLSPSDREILLIASTAAPFVRNARANQN